MRLLVKALGFLLILSASTLIGILKSYQLKYRYIKLNKIYLSVSGLKERIRLNGGEISRLINESFDKELININNNEFRVNQNGLHSRDITLINEFLSEIGMSDIKSECERTELYMALIFKQCELAEKSCSELCKLYKTLGFLCGAFICIFLL